jgi:glycosylphosphatidylinositol transamidase (GPIT) subunit GPI8
MRFEIEGKVFDNAEDAMDYYADIVGSDYNNIDVRNEEWFYFMCVDDIDIYDENDNPVSWEDAVI